MQSPQLCVEESEGGGEKRGCDAPVGSFEAEAGKAGERRGEGPGVRCERRDNGPVGDSAYVHHCRRRRPSLELRCVSHLQASQSGHCRCAIADRIVPSSELNAVQRHCRCEARATHARPSTEVELPRCNPIPGETPSPPTTSSSTPVLSSSAACA
jgi:hypothetical protein